mgnify:CR=1 FL=1
MVAKALAQPLAAEVTLVGRREAGAGLSDVEAGRIAGQAIEAASKAVRAGVETGSTAAGMRAGWDVGCAIRI